MVNSIFDSIVPKHIATKEMNVITKLRTIETTTQDLLDMRSHLLNYGDLNLLKDIKSRENLLDRTRKNVKLAKKREEEKQEKHKKQLKSKNSG